MDRRQRKSRAAIFRAFNHLLEKETYSKITVQEIIEEADVGRTTFYAHFPTKDDLLKELSKEILDHVFSSSRSKEATHDFSSGEMNLTAMITHILYHIRDNSPNISRILAANDSSSIFIRYFQERFSAYLEDQIGNEMVSAIPRSYVITILSSSLISTIEWWMKNDMTESPEDIAMFFSSIFFRKDAGRAYTEGEKGKQ